MVAALQDRRCSGDSELTKKVPTEPMLTLAAPVP